MDSKNDVQQFSFIEKCKNYMQKVLFYTIHFWLLKIYSIVFKMRNIIMMAWGRRGTV